MAGLRDLREFAAWQRAEELRQLVDQFLSRPNVKVRFRSADQLADASSSAPRNIAEGFGRFRRKEFAQFVRIAKGSETEVLNCFVEAKQKGLISDDDFARYETAAKRAIGTAVGLIKYLEKE